MNSMMRNIGIWLVIGLAMMVLFNLLGPRSSGSRELPFSDFISKVEYPITYFDFETFTDAVPVFKKQRPHMQMPFQYSMHIQSSKDEVLDLSLIHI